MKKKVFAVFGILAVAVLAAFAPPGVVFSKLGFIYPPALNVGASTSATALAAAGTAPFADTTSAPTTSTASGLYVFTVNETTGLELQFALTGAQGTTGTARVFRAIPVAASQYTSDKVQWTYRHVCDISLVASAQTGVTNGLIDATKRWATCTVTADAGLAPLGTRTLNGLTTNAAGSVVIDGLCAPKIVVQTCIGTATDISVLANDWTRN